jgi:hypothetical protein
MKLELKHLAPYLPYKLKLQIAGENIDDDPEDNPRVFNMVGIVDGEIYTHKGGYIDNIENEIEDCFPILRPLLDLDKFLLAKYYTNLMYADLERCIKDSLQWPLNQSYTFTQWLLSEHFDIIGLIEKGLAIDINTL